MLGKRVALVLSIFAAAPIGAVAIWSIHRTAQRLADPCAIWGSAQMSAAIGPHDPCRAVTVNPGSRAGEALVAAAAPGGLLAFAALAITGAARSRRRRVLAGAIGMLAETVVVFTIAPLTLAAGLVLLLIAWRQPAP